MGVESREAQALQNEFGDDEVSFGNLGRKKWKGIYPENTVFRVFTGCLNIPDEKEEYERLLTKSFHCQNVLKKPGDLALLTLNGTFDKQGAYHVACRYAILPENE